MKYEGWTNRNTWLVALHFNNDRMMYDQFNGLDDGLNPRQLAEAVEEIYTAACLREDLHPYASDVFDYFLAEVNFAEIVDSLI